MYGIAKELASIHCPLVGGSPHHIRNIQHFMEQAKSIHLQQGECMSYSHQYQWTLPWTSSVTSSSRILCSMIGPLSVQNIVTLLKLCLKSTFFTFQGKYYEQVQGAVMGSPISPVAANLFMKDFKARVLSTSPNLHSFCRLQWTTYHPNL